MGIRFLCPNGHKLNVKTELAGKRASCPECGTKLVIPATSTNGDSVVVAAVPGAASSATVASAASSMVAIATGAAAAATVASTGWYLRTPAGEQFGPATTDEFRALIIAGRIAGDTPIWRDGWPTWKHAREVPDQLPAPLAAVPAFAAVVPVAPTARAAPTVPASTVPKIDIPPIPESTPATPIFASPTVADPSLAATSVAVTAPLLVEDDATSLPGSIASELTDTTSASYIAQRQRAKRKQATLAILMLIAVLILGVVLVWVLMNNMGGESGPPAATPQTPATPESE